MRITDHIRQAIIGTDNTLTTPQIAEAVYGVKSTRRWDSPKPDKAQRVAINRAVKTVSDDKTICSMHGHRGQFVLFNPLSDRSVLIANYRTNAGGLLDSDARSWDEMDELGTKDMISLPAWLKRTLELARNPDDAEAIEAGYQKEQEKQNAAFKQFLSGPAPDQVAAHAMVKLFEYAQTQDDPTKLTMKHEGHKLVFTVS